VKTEGINSVRLSVYQPLEQIGNRKPANTREEFFEFKAENPNPYPFFSIGEAYTGILTR